MRKIKPASLLRTSHHALKYPPPARQIPHHPPILSPCRSLAQLQTSYETFPEIWFTSSSPPWRAPVEISQSPNDHPPDERTLKLGKTLRTLQPRLPTLLASPLPQEILSPHITLHLFPSTHPHLPTVSGRVAYHAALWTAPVAWGRVPIVGNVKLLILSERMVKNGSSPPQGVHNERLIVRWKTCGKLKSPSSSSSSNSPHQDRGPLYNNSPHKPIDKITEWLGVRDADEEFHGLFIFEFDEDGRILTHTIEHAEESGSWDKASRVVSVTDWLLGRAMGRKREKEVVGGLAWEFCGKGKMGWRGGAGRHSQV